MARLFELDPSYYGVPKTPQFESSDMKYAFKAAQRQLVKIQECQTPKTKLQQIGRAIEIIQHTFELCNDTEVTADDLVRILPYLFVRAKIDRLLAHFNFIEAFHRCESDGDPVEVYKTNF